LGTVRTTMAGYSHPNSTIIKIKRSELRPGDVLLGPAPRDLPLGRPRPRYLRRTSSLDRNDFSDPYRGRGTIARRREQPDPSDQYDSEGSVPPQSRKLTSENRRDTDRGNSNRNRSSSASSSDLGCTDDDEKNVKKAKWKKWGAIGLAGVAGIHAVHGVYETIEKTKERRKELEEGEISEEEAKRKKNRARWKEAANVGIAGVWIKSAWDEIKEYREAQHEHAEICEKAEERHRKRIERAKANKRGVSRAS